MTWEVGDLALCVDARDNPGFLKSASGLIEGRVYRVAAVTPPAYCGLYKNRCDVGLILVGVPCETPSGFAHERFRKIRPDEHEACEPEFITLLNRIKTKTPA